MSLLYTVVQRGNPGNLNAPKKYFLQAKIRGSKTHKQILAEAAQKNALNVKEIDNGVYAVLQALMANLEDGFSVEVEGLGTFSTSISSEGVDNEADATPARVKNITVAFRPKPEVHKAVNGFKLEKFVADRTL
jgi:predicted histone-like DNA-binding protein